MDVALHRGQHDRALLRARLLLHLGLEIGDRLLHHSGGVEHRRQLHLARAKQLAYRPHAVEQDVVDQIEWRILRERLFQYFFQALFVRALAYGFFTVDDGKLQLVLDRQRFHMRSGLGLPFAFLAGKVVHVFLQRVAVRSGIAINQLQREINFFLRNLV